MSPTSLVLMWGSLVLFRIRTNSAIEGAERMVGDGWRWFGRGTRRDVVSDQPV